MEADSVQAETAYISPASDCKPIQPLDADSACPYDARDMSDDAREKERRLFWVRTLRLREMREARGLDQERLSQALGHSTQSFASKIERGVTGLTVTDAERWAAACDHILEFRMQPREGAVTVTVEVVAALAPVVERLASMEPDDQALVAEVVDLLPTLRGYARRRLEEDARAWREELTAEQGAEALRAFAHSPAAARLSGEDAAALRRVIERVNEGTPDDANDNQRRKRSR